MGKFKGTSGPWQWFSYPDGRIYLGTPNRGRLVVMDFVRKGMNYAIPRFATWKGDERENMGGVMVPATAELVANHPDARLIAAAPDLLTACEKLDEIDCCAGYSIGDADLPKFWAALELARAALALAKKE